MDVALIRSTMSLATASNAAFARRTASWPCPPRTPRQLLEKIEFPYTPKHDSWVNMAETEAGITNSQCLDRRLDSATLIAEEVAAWEAERNDRKVRIH